MAWDDIDRSLIVPGLNTRSSNEVSFGFYLDEFSRALDERRNMIKSGGAASLGLEFGKGMIFNQTFSDRFRALISGYKSLWDDNSFYSSLVLSNPANESNFRINDADIIALITQEVWDIFSDPAAFLIKDLYTAAVINAMYTFYQNTGIILKSVGLSDTPTQNIPTFAVTGTSYNYDMMQNIGELDDPYGSVLAGTSFILTSNNQSPTLVDINYQARRSVISNVFFVWTAAENNNATSYDGSECFLLSKDLDDNILSMAYTPLFVVTNNAIFATDKDNIPYTTEFPLVDGGDVDILETFWAPKSSGQTVNGTKKEFYFRGSGPTGPKGLRDSRGDLTFYSELQQFSINIPNKIFVDINNAGLEFFIP